ncbi:MAG: alpha/beta fold hydrolase, partial [Bdellovibrionales bacterium]|nr:alpha/beta fold hydrolase [Bdellovibrionales bacterium]
MALLLMPCVAGAASYYDLKGKPSLKNPIVLVHGASMGGAKLKIGFLRLGEYFQGIPEFLSQTGTPVFVVNLPTDASIQERAQVLRMEIEQKFRGQAVNLVAHSLGGLDARFLVSRIKYDKVASITTIATPHRGSPLAEWAVRNGQRKTPWYWLLKLGGFDLNRPRFVPSLVPAAMEGVFNREIRDAEGVRYFSVIAVASRRRASLAPILWFPDAFLRGENHPVMSREDNDGLVPESSQEWGTVIARVELDHMGQLNHHFLRFPPVPEKSLSMWFQIYQNLLDR